MRTLTPREKRTVRYAAIGIAVYLVIFCGFQLWRGLAWIRSNYVQMQKQAQDLRVAIMPYQERALVLEKLMKDFRMDPAKLAKASLVAQASAAIQQAASSGGIQVGPIRESAALSTRKEMASVQFEGTGPIPAAMSLLHHLESLGYPLVIDSIQLTSQGTQPGQIKLNLTVVILDFEQWKDKETPHA